MSEPTKPKCARGCTVARRHVTDCEDRDECRGCLPRDADHGRLCRGCHRRLVDWLDNAPRQHALLLAAVEPSMEQLGDGERRGDSDDLPAALRVASLSAAQDLSDLLSCWVEYVCEQHDRTGPARQRQDPRKRERWRWSDYAQDYVWTEPPARFEILSACRWLVAQVAFLETSPGIGDMWGELGEAMSQAHCLAPWREQITRLSRIECPECHAAALVRFGGDEHVTCQRCNAHVEPGRYAIWVRMLTNEHAERATAEATPGIVTMREAAEHLGITPFTIRAWVARGHLAPLVAGAKPTLFRLIDVIECGLARLPKTRHEHLDALWRDIVADEDGQVVSY